MSKKRFVIKNVKKDVWANFLFQEMRKDEKRPVGSDWLTVYELQKLSKKPMHGLRVVLAELNQRKESEMFVGNIRSNKGYIQKAIWYRLKKGNWKNLFEKDLYKRRKQRVPIGKNWFTVGELTEKTGLARSKILRLLRVHKLNNRIQIFDGYKYNKTKRILERKIWYKLCLNGLNS